MEPQSRFPLIEWHKELDSTNDEAKRRRGELDNLSVIAAVSQTAGRGRGTHTWISAPGQNLTFTLVLRFEEGKVMPLSASEAVRITHFCTVALCDFLEAEGLHPRIKWPNDIWVCGRKICGILIENSFSEGMLSDSIIGIGLNLNQRQFDPSLPNPTSLSLLTGRDYPPAATLDALYEKICRRAEDLSSSDGRARLELEFSNRMFVLDKPSQDRIQASIEDFESRQ